MENVITKRERIIYFDIIKLIDTICVFTCHFTRTLESYGVGFDYKVLPDTVFSIYLGNFGVTLFFIVSGAALMYVYDAGLDIKTYMKKRFIGIYPLFWLTYIFAFFITFYNLGIDWSIPKWRFLYTILGCDGNMLWFYPTFYMVGEWFLSVIVLLYLIFPIIRIGILQKPYITLLTTASMLIFLTFVWKSSLPLDCLFLARMFEFTFGMFFVKIIKKPNTYLAIYSGIVLAIIVLFEEKLNILNSTVRTAIVGVAAFLFFTWLFQSVRGEKVGRMSIFVNKYMYGFFLTHHFVQQELLRKFVGRYLTIADVLLAYILCFSITVVVTVSLARLNQKILSKFTAERRN